MRKRVSRLPGLSVLLLAIAAAGNGAATARPGSAAPSPIAHQGGIAGQYTLRSVDGVDLPAPLAGQDAHHKVQVTSGVLILRPDGSYVCRTVGQTSDLGFKEQFTDSLHGTYTLLQSGAISLGTVAGKADTIRTLGYQIAWPHGVRTWFGRFLYSR